MDARLELAFRSTHYRVLWPVAPFTLQVGAHSEPLQHLMRAHDVSCAALLTAFNPGATRRAASENARAQQALRRALRSQVEFVLDCRNEDPAHTWPDEESLLALGLGLHASRHAAATHGQLAFLWMGAEATPQLIETATAL